jgi:hypothetical protein
MASRLGHAVSTSVRAGSKRCCCRRKLSVKRLRSVFHLPTMNLSLRMRSAPSDFSHFCLCRHRSIFEKKNLNSKRDRLTQLGIVRFGDAAFSLTTAGAMLAGWAIAVRHTMDREVEGFPSGRGTNASAAQR